MPFVSSKPVRCIARLSVLLVVPLAIASGQAAHANDREVRARICVNAYNSLLKADSRFVADNRAAIETRRQSLSKKFDIDAPAITPDGSRIGELLADFTSAQISDCENQFTDLPAFQPPIYAGRAPLMASAKAAPPAPPPAKPAPAQPTPSSFEPSVLNCAAVYARIQDSQVEEEMSNTLADIGALLGVSAPPALPDVSTDYRQTAFFKLSNAESIWAWKRLATLREKAGYGDGRRWDELEQTKRRITLPTRDWAGFEYATKDPATGRFTLPPKEKTPAFAHHVTACDRAHGFSPVFWFRAPEPLDCAVALFMPGFDGPQFQERARAEATQAVSAHLAAHGGDRHAISTEVRRRAEQRAAAIMEGTDFVENVHKEIQVCRLDLGLEP